MIATLVFGALFYLVIKSRRTRDSRLPPGPKPLPLIGNLLDVPTSFEWETYSRWGKEFSKSTNKFPRPNVSYL